MATDRTALTFTDPATCRTAGHKRDVPGTGRCPPTAPADRATILRALLDRRRRGADVGFGIASLWDREAVRTSPEEYRLATRLVPERRSDFLIGRRALHNGLAGIGLDPGGPIGFSGRRPRMPASAVGSISHSAGIAIAAPRACPTWQSMSATSLPLLKISMKNLRPGGPSGVFGNGRGQLRRQLHPARPATLWSAPWKIGSLRADRATTRQPP